MRSPTLLAEAMLPVPPSRRSDSRLDAAARVRPVESSITWATMCLLDRNTARRGRSLVPRTPLRTRAWRRARASCFFLVEIDIAGSWLLFRALLLGGLAGLADDPLARVLDALALVGLGLAELADVGGDLADRLLVV